MSESSHFSEPVPASLPFSELVSASGYRPPAYEEHLTILTQLCQELPSKLDEANYVPLSDILEKFESIVPTLTGRHLHCKTAPIRKIQVFGELKRIHGIMQLHTDAHIVKLEAFLARIRVEEKKLWESYWG